MKREVELIWLVVCFSGFVANAILLGMPGMYGLKLLGLVCCATGTFCWVVSLLRPHCSCGYLITRKEAKFCPQCGAPAKAEESSTDALAGGVDFVQKRDSESS